MMTQWMISLVFLLPPSALTNYITTAVDGIFLVPNLVEKSQSPNLAWEPCSLLLEGGKVNDVVIADTQHAYA